MKNDLETSLRSLEEATAAGDRPADRLDAETASLREAWLAFGEMLEAAQPPRLRYFSPLPLGEGPGVRAALRVRRRRWRRLLAAGLLAASLLIAVATIWMLSGANRQRQSRRCAATDGLDESSRLPHPQKHAPRASHRPTRRNGTTRSTNSLNRSAGRCSVFERTRRSEPTPSDRLNIDWSNSAKTIQADSL